MTEFHFHPPPASAGGTQMNDLYFSPQRADVHMSYAKIAIPNLLTGETGYQLDGASGPCVAASCKFVRDSNTQSIDCIVLVRQVNCKDGRPVRDPTGKVVTATHVTTVSSTLIEAAGGQARIAADTLKIALGEPDTTADASDDIRDAIAAAALAKASFDLGSL